MAEATITIPDSNWSFDGIRLTWFAPSNGRLSIGSDLSANGNELFLGVFGFRIDTGALRVEFESTQGGNPGTGNDLSPQMEMSGIITLVASDNSMVTITGFGDSTEPYNWTPSNQADVIAFANTLSALLDRSLTVTFNDDPPIAPSFTDSTGDDQSFEVGDAISAITVPEADGTPTPTYAVHDGSLPGGLSFNASTRIISGMPATTGHGTITIRASNPEGTADYTIKYVISDDDTRVVRIPAAEIVTDTTSQKRWDLDNADAVELGGDIVPSGETRYFRRLIARNDVGGYDLRFNLHFSSDATENATSSGDDLTSEWEDAGEAITVEQDDDSADSDGPNNSSNALRDASDGYTFAPSIAQQAALDTFFFTDLDTSEDLIVIFNNPGPPNFADNMGSYRDFIVDQPIAAITVPEADGTPTPTYAVHDGSLPGGLSFDPGTRVISGTPVVLGGRGTIIIRATNAEGSDDWTIDYSIVAAPPVDIYVLVDTDDDESYSRDIFPAIKSLRFGAGASGARRGRIAASAGTLSCILRNSDGAYSASDLKTKSIRVRRNDLAIWGGVIDDVEDIELRGNRNDLRVTALGRLTFVGGTVEDAISESGEIPVNTAVESLLGLSGLTPSPQTLNDWTVDAGANKLRELQVIQEDSGSRVYEDGTGTIQVASNSIAELWDITLAGANAVSGDRVARRIRRDEPNSSIINAVLINAQKYSDSDSVDTYGEHRSGSDFEFVTPGTEQALAADIFSLYADPANIFSASILLEQLAPGDEDAQNAVLELLHYGNERILRVRDSGGVTRIVEVIYVEHTLNQGFRHIINLQLRERGLTDLMLTLCSYHAGNVGYFASLPVTDDSGRPITGHKIQFRQVGEIPWTDYVSPSGGLVLNGEFAVPMGNVEYEVRLVATNSHGDQQMTPTQILKALEPTLAYNETFGVFGNLNGLSLTYPTVQTVQTFRSIRMSSPNFAASVTTLRILGFDVQVRYQNLGALFPAWDVVFNADGGPVQNLAQNMLYALIRRVESNIHLYHIPTGVEFNQTYGSMLPPNLAYNTFYPSGAQLRYRPIFTDSTSATWEDDRATAERGLWTTWIDIEDITATYTP